MQQMGPMPLGAVPDLGALRGQPQEMPLAPIKADCLRMAIQAVGALDDDHKITDVSDIKELADRFFFYIFGDAPTQGR